MSIANSRNSRNSRGLANSRNSRAGAVDDDGIAAALLTVREAILPPQRVPAITAPPATAQPLDRLLRLEGDFARAVLLADMHDALSVTAEPLQGRLHLRDGTDLATATVPDPGALAGQVSVVAGYADLRPERLAEILVQSEELAGFFDSLHGVAGPAGLALLDLAAELATSVAQRLKLGFAVARPVTRSDAVQPIIPTPGHGSYPSGHATQAFAIATVLDHLAGGTGPLTDAPVWRLATRIAVNRTVAGVHYPVDSALGAVLGVTLGRAILARGGAVATVAPLSFDANVWMGAGGEDFFAARVPDLLAAAGAAAVAVPTSPLMTALVTRAVQEWAVRWR